jgi:hypothetical protein
VTSLFFSKGKSRSTRGATLCHARSVSRHHPANIMKRIVSEVLRRLAEAGCVANCDLAQQESEHFGYNSLDRAAWAMGVE